MEFRILGPLEVRDGGRVVAVRAAKQRALLAGLLLHANQAVPTGRLIELLWGGQAPPSAKVALQNYVVQLRRLLDAAAHRGGAVVVTQPPGYLVLAGPGELDMLSFERLVADGRQARAVGDVGQAASLLRSALALWRGPALADVDAEPLLHGEATWLEERRLAAVDDWVEAELLLGRHQQLVAELRALVAAHPLREHLRWQLMLALYRSGRRADALQAYRETRQVLVAELGLEPGLELQRLQQAILAADPALDPAGPALDQAGPGRQQSGTGHRPWPSPAQLPPDVAGFTGRDRELAELDILLGATGQPGRAAITAISGAGGVGKSALAVHAAHRLAGQFPDGQLYVDLRGASSRGPALEPLEVLGRFLRSLGVAAAQVPSDLEEAAGLFRSLLASLRLLVVLDDAAGTDQVRPLLPASPGCAVLVTSRHTLAGLDGAAHLRLGLLAPVQAVALLTLGAGPERVAADPEAAALLARQCGHLPLALRIAGAKLAARPTWPLRTLASRLADHSRRLDELQQDGLAVRDSFQTSYDALRAAPRAAVDCDARAFRLLGLLDGPEVTVATAGALLDQPPDLAEAALERLVDAQLLESLTPGRYRLHDLLRLFAHERAHTDEDEPTRRAALERVLDRSAAEGRSAWQRGEPVERRSEVGAEQLDLDVRFQT